MTELNTKKVSLSLGIVFAIMHTIGIIGIFVGLIKYAEWVHFINDELTVQPFSLLPFVLGIATAFVIGAVVGWLFATVYNFMK